MRLIDADALMDKHRKEERERYGGTFVVGDNRFMQRFMDAPTVDAVEINKVKRQIERFSGYLDEDMISRIKHAIDSIER